MNVRSLVAHTWAGVARPGTPLQPLWGRWGADSLWGWTGATEAEALWTFSQMYDDE